MKLGAVARPFKFIEVFYKNAYYSINFMRYTCDNNGTVGCTMREIQFHTDGGSINIGNEGFNICYPSDDKDNNFKKINSYVTQNRKKIERKNICYNPPVSYPNHEIMTKLVNNEKLNKVEEKNLNNQIQDIINCFIQFIEKGVDIKSWEYKALDKTNTELFDDCLNKLQSK